MTDTTASELTPSPDLVHPEEIRATLDVPFGQGRSLTATARCTPAGLVAVGVMVSGILLSVATVVWAARRRPY